MSELNYDSELDFDDDRSPAPSRSRPRTRSGSRPSRSRPRSRSGSRSLSGSRSRSPSGSRSGSRGRSSSRGRSRSRGRSGSRSGSGSRSRGGSRSRSPSRNRSRSRSRSGSRSGSRAASLPKFSSPHAAREGSSVVSGASEDEGDEISIRALREYAKLDISYQTEPITSTLDQKDILAEARALYGVKKLTDYIPGSMRDGKTGVHFLGCPCTPCVTLDKKLADGDRRLIRKVRAIKDWIPKGKRRPRCLTLPSVVPASGQQKEPYVFCGPEKILLQLEKAFAAGAFIHPLVFYGKGANSAPNLSSGWVGGKAQPPPSAAPGGRSYTIPKIEKAVSFARKGARGWERFEVREAAAKPSHYMASRPAMEKIRDLHSIGRTSLEKRVREWSSQHLSLPDNQFDQIKMQSIPPRFDKVVKMDGTASARDKALRAVGVPLNYAVTGSIRISECVTQVDQMLPEFEGQLAAMASLKPPRYIAPNEIKDLANIKAGADKELRFLHDPAPGSDPKGHWLRKKGEDFLGKSAVLKDIFIKAQGDVDTGEVPPVPRDVFLEVCWRAALMREHIKKTQDYAAAMEELNSRALTALNLLSTEITTLQDVFSHNLYPALGWVRASIMFQRFDHLRDQLTPEFREFAKRKASKDLLPDGTERSVMQFLIDDPEAICSEFSEWMRNRPKEGAIFKTPAKPQSGGGGNGGGGGKSKGKAKRKPKKRARGGDRSRRRSRSRSRSRSPLPRPGTSRGHGRDRSRSRHDRKRSRDDDYDDHGRDSGSNRGKRPRKDNGGRSGNGGGGRDKKNNSKKSASGRNSKRGEVSLSNDLSPQEIVSGLGFDVSILADVLSLPEAGRSQQCLDAWKVITDSSWVLKTIEHGVTWSWKAGPPRKSFKAPRNPEGDFDILSFEFQELRRKGALITRDQLPRPKGISYVVSYFSVPKKDKDKHRPITNLKPLNRLISNSKFKMETVKSVRKWLVRGAFMISLDLSDAYLSLAMARDRWQYMGIEWEGIEYFFTALCFGLNVGPRVFSKCLKKVIQFFRKELLIWVSFYLDDLLAQDTDPQRLVRNAEVMTTILHLLGFRVNLSKSDLVPSQQITHLGFEFNTIDMTVSLPMDKVDKIRGMVSSTISRGTASVKQLQTLMGTLESTRPAVRIAPLHYRRTQELLVTATKKEWPVSRILSLSDSVKQELQWWVSSLEDCRSSPMRDPPADISIWSDAATDEGCGWGGYTSLGTSAQGVWSEEEREMHINVLETLGAVNVIEALLPPNTSAAHFIDNTTAVAYVRNFGGTKSKGSCERALRYWDIVLGRNCWVTPSHIAGKDNVMADYFSRHTVEHHEYGLVQEVFDRVVRHFFTPRFDLFASKDLHVVSDWASFCWTKGAKSGDAFLMKRWPDKAFIFPPQPLLNEVVARLARQDIDFILVAPLSSDGTGPMWLPILKTLISEEPLVLGKTREICRLRTGKRPDIPGHLAAFTRSVSSRRL